MKKSEKVKGKEQAAEKKRTLTYAGAGVVAVMVVAVVLYVALVPPVAQLGDTVSVAYVGQLNNGSVFDSNVNKTPLSFTLGAHTMIPGFENAVTNMKKDEVKTVHIPYDQAYGAYQSDLVYTLDRSMFSSDTQPEVGMFYTITNPSGTSSRVKVTGVNESTVTIDANHMLAGENLTFTIRLLTITKGK